MSRPRAPKGYPYSAGALRAQAGLASNALKDCTVAGCHMPRAAVYQFCAHHRNVSARWGSPTARPVFCKDYGVERNIVDEFLTYHRDHGHGGVHAALQFWEKYLRDCVAHEPVPGAKEVRRRMSENPIDAWTLLVETTALFLFSRWREDRLQGGLPLTYQISKAVFRVHSRERGVRHIYRPIPIPVRKGIGEFVRDQIGGFFMSVVLAIEAQEVEENNRKKLLASGFAPMPPPRVHADGSPMRKYTRREKVT